MRRTPRRYHAVEFGKRGPQKVTRDDSEPATADEQKRLRSIVCLRRGRAPRGARRSAAARGREPQQAAHERARVIYARACAQPILLGGLEGPEQAQRVRRHSVRGSGSRARRGCRAARGGRTCCVRDCCKHRREAGAACASVVVGERLALGRSREGRAQLGCVLLGRVSARARLVARPARRSNRSS
jgi:hypothetical protein